ncbi:MAG: hypothetical protein NTY57_03825 [Solirubrobacterales bacterium]|nr:hypothetical protein [Solirubrobacterales bacterium]
MAEGDAKRLADLLGLSDDELCEALGASSLDLISGDADSLTAVPILTELLREAEEAAGEKLLRRWVRTGGPAGVPVELLVARNYIGFEDALGALSERGFVIRGGGA